VGVADGSAALGNRAEADFEVFARGIMHRLLRTAVFLVGDRHTAEDLVQVCLERTARHWRRIGGDNPEAYSRKVLVNLAIDRTRKLKRGRDTPIGAATDLDLLGSARDVLSGLESGDADASGDLAAGLAALPARQRAVLVLRYWCDLDEREIADTLGISTGSVKTHASRGLNALHGRLTSTSEVPR
jgi:RNA polymerase sigma-70 factor (sigma-E family)